MPIKKLTALEKITFNLFKSKAEAELELTMDELEIKERYMFAFSRWLESPLTTDKSMVDLLMNQFDIEKSQAYKDIASVKTILGNIKPANKAWIRHMVNEGLKEVLARAKKSKNLIAEIMALDKLGKYNKLDKEEEEPIPWDQLIPPEFELSSDVRVLDEKLFDPNIEERRKKVREKYKSAVYTDFEDVKG